MQFFIFDILSGELQYFLDDIPTKPVYTSPEKVSSVISVNPIPIIPAMTIPLARTANPTGTVLETKLAALESGEAASKFVDSLELCTLAVSLGDAGIPEGLVRLSVGLENVDDIIADLQAGLDTL